jgi:hypothetical protein
VSKATDNEIDGYNLGLEICAALITGMGGDPANPTSEQAQAAASILLDVIAGTDYRPTTDELMKDHRRISMAARRKRQ